MGGLPRGRPRSAPGSRSPPMQVHITGTMVLQVVVSGLLVGGLYALVALGLSLVFGVMRVINVAHGTILMLGAYITYWLFSLLGMNPFVSLLISFPALFLLGGALQRLFGFRVVNAPELSSLLLTFAISIVLATVAMLGWSAACRSVELLPGPFALGDIAVSKPRLLSFLMAVVITALAFLFLQKTRTGKAIRATSQHREVAQVCGINVRRIDLIA